MTHVATHVSTILRRSFAKFKLRQILPIALFVVLPTIVVSVAPTRVSLAQPPAPSESMTSPEPTSPQDAAALPGQPSSAVEPGAESTEWSEGERKAEEVLASPPESEEQAALTDSAEVPQINVLDLAFRGGVLMIPITLMSVLTVIFGLERALGLRRRKVVPNELIRALGTMGEEKRTFDPRAAYRLAQRYPSAAANVLKAMLVKVGRPLPEIEQAMRDATEREAERLYGNVRMLTLSAAVTPLLGLLGTVQGMIQAFFVTSHLPTGADRAEMLAQGIYIALVTTFAGLCVAIPAAVLAHYFEGRIQNLLREIDESLLGLVPQLEVYEGRLRIKHDQPSPVEPSARHEVPLPPPPPSVAARSGDLP